MTDVIALSLNYHDVAFEVSLNGFPVCDADTDSDGFLSVPLNGETVAGENLLRVTVTRRGAEGSLGLRVDVQETGTFVDSAAEAQVQLPAGDAPLTLEHRFDSEFDHLGSLLASTRASDEAEMTAYALTLRDAFKAGDPSAILPHFATKLQAVATAFGQPVEMMQQQFAGMLTSFIDAGIDYEAADVRPVPFCDKRLWRLERADGSPLFRIEDEEGSFSLDLVTACLADGPAVVK